MASWALIQSNLLSPMVLAFVLGLFAMLMKSDLKFPEAIYTGLSIYLLTAIGLKGGSALSHASFQEFWPAGLATLALGFTLPLIAYALVKYVAHLDRMNAAAIAAHYGSVSVVTFIAAQVFTQEADHIPEGFMPALVAILEVPGIVVALLIAQSTKLSELLPRVKNILVSKSVLLLMGGLIIGYLSGDQGYERVAPFFVDPFQGILVLFLMDMGVVAGARLGDLKYVKPSLWAMAILIPIINGTLGVSLGYFAGMSVGGATVLGAMAASASYIAAPAAVRLALPQANPAYYLTTALVITFPFNLSFGIPIYHQMAIWLYGIS